MGAGFSKALANFPLAKDLLDPGHIRTLESQSHRANESSRVLKAFLSAWQSAILVKTNTRAEDVIAPPIPDLEELLTFLQLNVQSRVRFRVRAGEQVACCMYDLGAYDMLPSISFQQVHCALLNLLWEVLARGISPGQSVVNAFKSKILASENIEFISLNYDIVLETLLWEMGAWSPIAGYGFSAEIDSTEIERLPGDAMDCRVHKLHGSINWIPRNNGSADGTAMQLRMHFDDGSPMLAGQPPHGSHEKGRPYTGHRNFACVTPTWIKDVASSHDMRLNTTWRNAAQALRDCEAVTLIGYSLPSSDAAIYGLLVGAGLASKRVTIVDPAADDIARRMRANWGVAEVEAINKPFQEYLLAQDL